MRTSLRLVSITLLCHTLLSGERRLIPHIRSVYIVSMEGGLDQYIANRLTSGSVTWVVLEPARADAIITDRVDESFWAWLNGRPSGPQPPAMNASNDERGSKRFKGTKFFRGTIFLVDPKDKVILWSTYSGATLGSPAQLDHVASRVANRLKDSFITK